MAGAFPISGTIDPQAFPFLLMDLHRRGATGSLKVEGPSYQKALYVRGGRVLFGSSNDPRDQLGAILIETGTLTPEQLEEANSKVGPGSPLAKVLVDTGFVSQRELSEAARAKVERILSDVIAYTAGSFEFEDGVLPKGSIDLKLSTERLLLGAVRRVSDRGFVLRHLEGLDVVLSRVPDMDGTLPEVENEAAELLAQLNGERTLKEAAAATRLDEFEAAKLACTLLFLGLVERTHEAAPAAEMPAAFRTADEPRGEIDLSATAAEALGGASIATGSGALLAEAEPPPPARPSALPARTAAAPKGDEPELGIFVPDDAGQRPAAPLPSFLSSSSEPEPEPEPVFTAPSPIDLSEPTSPAPAQRSAPTPAANPLPPPPSPAATPVPAFLASETPELEIPPAPAAVGPSKREAREWRPSAIPGGPPVPPRPSLPEIEDEPPVPASSPSRPSKDDLAALDALLSAKGLEGPLQPMERPSQERWSPQFGTSSSARRGAHPRAASSSRLTVAALVVLGVVAGGAGLWYYLGREQQGVAAMPSSTTVAPRRSTSAGAEGGSDSVHAQAGNAAPTSPVTGQPTARASPSPTAPPTGAAPPSTTLASVPTPSMPTPPTAAPVANPARTSAGGAITTLGDARSMLANGRLPDAARGFASNLKAAPAGALSVQLLVACSADTVQKAVATIQSPELYILPVNYKGRDCFRLCWGLYTSSDQADSAVRALPDYFRRGGATPRVMRASELLP
jgi:hypothetical protein